MILVLGEVNNLSWNKTLAIAGKVPYTDGHLIVVNESCTYPRHQIFNLTVTRALSYNP